MESVNHLLEELKHLFEPSSMNYKAEIELCEVLGRLKSVTFTPNALVSKEDFLSTKRNFVNYLRKPGLNLGPVFVQQGNKIVVCAGSPLDENSPELKRARRDC